MAKIKKTDISKLSKIDQQIEELKQQRKNQEEQLSKKIGSYFLSKLDLDTIQKSVELYNLIDKVIDEYNSDNKSSLDKINKKVDTTMELNKNDNDDQTS